MPYNPYNPYNWGQTQTVYPAYQQQSFAPMPMQTAPIPQKPIFVDGEMAARVFQMPDNWPIGVPLYLWDSNGDFFYVKMIGANGAPMPLQKYHYQQQETSGYLTGASQPQVDMNQFVTKADFEQMKNELKDMMRNNQGGRNQNGSNNSQNRGGNQ